MILLLLRFASEGPVKAWKPPPARSLRLMDLSRQDLANSGLHSILPSYFLRLLAWLSRLYLINFV